MTQIHCVSMTSCSKATDWKKTTRLYLTLVRRKKMTVMITLLTIVFRSWSFSFPHTPFCTHKRTDWWSLTTPLPRVYCDVVPVCRASVYGVFWSIFSLAQGHRQEKGQNRRKSIRLLDKQSLHLHQ